MPQIKFTDRNLKFLSADKTTWFTDPDVKGLRLCVTAGGVKTWYVNKWDPTAQKTRSVKLAQWANQGTHCAWAKKQLGATVQAITSGEVRTRDEKASANLGVPTFSEALDQFITHRTAARASGKAPMTATTAKDYRGSFNLHLGRWADTLVTELPILEINQYLNALQLSKPEAASRAAAVAGGVVRFVNKLCALALPIPGLLDPTKHKSRVETGRLDMQVPLASRVADIDTVDNEHKRLCLMLTVYTGLRSRPLRELTWNDVDMDARTITLRRPIKKKTGDRTIALADDAWRIVERLREIQEPDCDWVFPSRRVVGDERGHLDAIDKFGGTSHGDLRHYWMTIARGACALHVQRWLGLHTLTGDDLRMVGHYGEPTIDEQRDGANAIAAAVNQALGRGPSRVVAIHRDVG